MADVKRVYTFGNKAAEGNGKMRELLGGKGANLAEMNLIGIPVPPGFTITTEVCTEYYAHGKDKVIELLRPEVERAVKHIEQLTNMRFGDKTMPLLVSVRSGARAQEMINGEGPTKAAKRPSRLWPSARAIRVLHGIPTAASYRCTATWCWV